MYYPFCSFEDETELVCTLWDNEKTVILIETPDEEYCFKTLRIIIPEYKILYKYGFTETEIEDWILFCRENEENIIHFSRKQFNR